MGTGTKTLPVNANATATVPAALFAPPPPPANNFLKVSYSLDGQTWVELSKVNPDNWQNFTATLPIVSWDNLKKLQIKIEGIPTALRPVPQVYLDGMFVEVHYEIPPPIPLLNNIPVPAAPATLAPTPPAAAPPQVITLPPSEKLVPVGQDSDFQANESPTFDFNLNALPAPSSTAATSTASSTATSTSFAPSLLDRLAYFFLRAAGVDRPATAHAQQAAVKRQDELPDANNPVVARIFEPGGALTNLQPVILVTGGNLRVTLPNPGRAFVPGKYLLKLLMWKNGVVYVTQSDFRWGVLAVNFNKSIYRAGDVAHIGFGLLTAQGHTVCNGDIAMDVSSPSGKISHFSTGDGTIARNPTCGPNTVTNNPDYSAAMQVAEPGTHRVAVVARNPDTGDRVAATDSFEVQGDPLFDVERSEATRIYPPATYQAAIKIIPAADYAGAVLESVPAAFRVTTETFSERTFSGDTQTISWQVNLKKGVETDLTYSFQAPDISPELYKLGPLQIGGWRETRQWQIAADANTVIFLTGTASTTWVVPSDWNSASNTIEVIGGGGGGASSATAGVGGGGGGAYSKATNVNLTAGATVTIAVGTGGAAGAAGGDTFLCNTLTTNCANIAGTAVVSGAKGGSGGVGTAAGAGGATSTSVGATKFGGGTGGSGVGSGGGGGGGGAGAPGGNGLVGGAGEAAAGVGGGGGGGAGGALSTAGAVGSGGVGGAGGAGPAGTGGGAGGAATVAGGAGSNGGGGGGGGDSANGGTGGAGTQWDATHGAGGGGGGTGDNTAAVTGGSGALYGGGGGGGNTGGTGAQGIIVVTYTPAVAGTLQVSRVVLNASSAIILTPNATTTISVVASTTAGANPISYATSTIYRSGVGATCAASNLNCYQLASSSCVFSGATTTVTCTADIWYFAQATDASSSFSAQNWQAAITITDSANATNTSSTATGVALNTLLAINVTTSSINYGTLLASSTTGTNQTTTVANAGNSSTTLQIAGTALVKGADIIATSSQHYATGTFTFGGAEQLLSGTAAAVSGFTLTAPTTTTNVTGNIFWGVTVPGGTATGTYNGTSTFTAVFSP